MKILFVHQNFPGQFKWLAPALVQQGHQVEALLLKKNTKPRWHGITLNRYSIDRGSSTEIHPWVSDFESKVIRGEGCFRAALKLQQRGFYPDLIIAHHGWGESLFLKEVWPEARLGIYCEFFYHAQGVDIGFDPEFAPQDPSENCRLQLKNLNNLYHFPLADGGLSPTRFQADTFPEPFRSRITVIHDGIDTTTVTPNPKVRLALKEGLTLSRDQEVITFVNRNLEPYRGYHTFMRALPDMVRRRPQAHFLIVGENGVSYGKAPPSGESWKEIFLNEIRQQIPDSAWSRIHFLGFIPYHHFIPLLQLSTVHIYLTYPFVLSWSLLEAMSVGCTIVGSDTAPLQEVIRDGINGRLVDFFNPTELAATVDELIVDQAQRKRLGSAARQHIIDHYDLKRVCLPQQFQWVAQLSTPDPE